VKFHHRSFEAIILPCASQGRARETSTVQLWALLPGRSLLSESLLHFLLGIQKLVTSAFEAQLTKCHLTWLRFGFPFLISLPLTVHGKKTKRKTAVTEVMNG
jgi:hypothetical protein